MTKWLGHIAFAGLIMGACSQSNDSAAAIRDAPVAEAPATSGWVSAAPVSATAPAPSIAGIPAGDYKLDPSHATFLFKLSHLGFSNFTLWFDRFEADLKLDPANPSMAMLRASVDPSSLTVHAPPGEFQDHLRGEGYLSAKQYPKITFASTAIEMTGPNTADVIGDLTLHGVTKPITLKMTYNGGYVGHIYEPRARIGFSAHGTFLRSDFGIAGGVPAPGENMGVSDQVSVVIEAEFLGPDMKDPPKPPGAPN